ncbi:MAG TPA: hypothetical protein DD473_04525 [Planctomycetaceae bacterium]|nr:hypothetical protein [Planctomycetaceae bacterium]|tara:strand:- start:664 stop:1254 length:591 start_codon:yes stop_codon:yes gene_type:complete
MPKRFLIIDGYNLLHASGMMPGRIDGEMLARARARLLRFLEGRITTSERERTTIVFDVNRTMAEVNERETAHGMTVLNAISYPDADTLIEKLIREHSAPKQVVVVSSDHRLHKAARARKAKPVDSEDFYEELTRKSRKRSRSKPGPNSNPTLGNPFSEDDLKRLNEILSESADLPVTSTDGELKYWEERIRELDEE